MINIAVVGAGYWGPNLIRNFYQSPAFELKAICDKSKKKLDKLHNLYPYVEFTSSFKKILNDPDIDAVAIATPIQTHYDLASQALKAGKHCFVEKPLTDSPKTSKKLIDLAEKHNKILMVGHTFLYADAVEELKKLTQKKSFGKPLYMYCQRLNLGLFQERINVVWDLAPHDLSILFYLAGSYDFEILSSTGIAHYLKEIEDVAFISMRIGKIYANLHVSWLDPAKIRKLTIVGKNQMLIYDDIEPLEKIKIYNKKVEVPDDALSFGEFNLSYRYGDVRIPKLPSSEPLRRVVEQFAKSIKKNKPPISDGLNGYYVVKAVHEINKKMKKCVKRA